MRRLLPTIPVRKPGPQQWFRVHPDKAFRLETETFVVKETEEVYLVDRSVWGELNEELVSKVLYTCVTRQGHVFLWHIRLPGEDGRIYDWNCSA